MRIGEMFLGRVEVQGEQSVQTKFFIFGVPLFPMQSFWATADTGSGVLGFPIPFHPMSVAMGYLRLYSWLGALLGAVFAYVEHRSYRPHYEYFVLAGVCLAVAVAAQFYFGRVSGREGVRREVLHRFTGLYAPPEIMPADKRMEIAMVLLRRWKESRPGTDWKQHVDGGKATASEQALLYALARYQQDPRAEGVAVAMGM